MLFCPSSAYFFGLLICYNTGLSISGSYGVLFFSGGSLSNLFSQKQPAKLLLDLFQALAWFILSLLYLHWRCLCHAVNSLTKEYAAHVPGSRAFISS